MTYNLNVECGCAWWRCSTVDRFVKPVAGIGVIGISSYYSTFVPHIGFGISSVYLSSLQSSDESYGKRGKKNFCEMHARS